MLMKNTEQILLSQTRTSVSFYVSCDAECLLWNQACPAYVYSVSAIPAQPIGREQSLIPLCQAKVTVIWFKLVLWFMAIEVVCLAHDCETQVLTFDVGIPESQS